MLNDEDVIKAKSRSDLVSLALVFFKGANVLRVVACQAGNDNMGVGSKLTISFLHQSGLDCLAQSSTRHCCHLWKHAKRRSIY